jgi:hypothetical protein
MICTALSHRNSPRQGGRAVANLPVGEGTTDPVMPDVRTLYWSVPSGPIVFHFRKSGIRDSRDRFQRCSKQVTARETPSAIDRRFRRDKPPPPTHQSVKTYLRREEAGN